ncbi:mannonate dehydratase [Halalkalicoccus tibetensis]|uniref:mannonate dehydratase n=1 Tax=Halalkalicoccus tibetensis TaxID=175632 RepID=A0ABD5V4Z2_9EURY
MAERPPEASTERFDELPMRVGLGQFMQPTRERLRYISQLGVEHVLLNMYATPLLSDTEVPLTGEKEWAFDELVQLRNRVEDAGLRLNAIENIPISFYDDVMLGGPGRDEQLEHVKNTIRNMGRAGIPVLGYHWSPSGVWRTSTSRRVRGGAESTGLDAAELENAPLSHGREYTEEELWKNYERFLEAVLPVAEEADVTLALHPNDPPLERVAGMPFLFRDFESFRRAMELVPSENHGLEFCLGTWAEMGEDLFEAIEHFGGRDELVYVHFRNVEGTIPSFTETFIDEGDYDPYAILEALDEAGFSGMMIPDHVPRLEGDDDWKDRGRAYTVGYMKGMLRGIR